MRYGEEVTTSVDEQGRKTEQVQKYANWATVKKFTRQSETVRVKDDQEVLAEFLKLLDRQKSGEIHSISFECVPTQQSAAQIDRIKKSWICA